MPIKEYKTIDEQIAILRSRGLRIDDENQAKEFLIRNNYYRISGYSLTLRKNDVFYDSASFQNIIDIYCFDRELRHLILKYIETIEVTVKSLYAHEFSKIHGPIGYLNSSFYTDSNRHREILEKVNKQKERRLYQEAYLKHCVLELHQEVPLWAYIDLFTFSDISFFIMISELSIRSSIAKQLGFSTKNGVDILEKSLHSLTIIRNMCAHGCRIYNRVFEHKPFLKKKDYQALRTDQNGIIDNSHFYGYLFLMKQLLLQKDFKQMKDSIIELTKKYPFVDMKYYGF